MDDVKSEEDCDYENEPLSMLRVMWSSRKESQTKNDLACVSCDSSFKTGNELTEHLYQIHEKGLKCTHCSRILPDTSSMTDHLVSEHPDQDCKSGLRTGKPLELGKRKHVNSRSCKSKMEENGVKLANGEVENTKMKLKVSEQKKNYPCDSCDSSFTLKNKLLKHKNQEHGADIRCDICSLTFSSMVSLRSHKFTKHTGKDKICEICGYSTKKTYDFKRHQVKHSNVYAIKCTVCNKGFYSQYDFNEHKNVHTAERPYQCEVCGVDYSRRSSLILHRNRKHPETYDLSKRCQICNQVCLTKETMASHIKTHVEGRKKFYCDICGKGLLTRVILKIHRRSHTGEKPFDCSYCGRAFSCKKNLSVHIRLHTGDRPYSCKFCWKAYTKSSALKAHEKSHSNHHQVMTFYAKIKSEPLSDEEREDGALSIVLDVEETGIKLETSSIDIEETPIKLESNSTDVEDVGKGPTKLDKSPTAVEVTPKKLDSSPTDVEEKCPCEYCGEYYSKRLLGRHKKRHMTARKDHKCKDCGKSFTVLTKLVQHMKQHHGTEMSCAQCDKQFRKISTFASHMKKHSKEKSFVCDVCGFATIEKLTLLNHKLVRHKIGEYPLHCSHCKKGFLSNYALKDHMNRHTGATPHQCHKCGTAYASIKALDRHSYKCNPESYKNSIFQCKLCKTIFKHKKNLEVHEQKKHPDGKGNVCEFCGKEFSFRESLVRHRRIHTGEKPKECSICKKRFACSTYLQCHMRTHTGEKPYQCRFCWKKFSQRSSLVTHEKSHLKSLSSSGIELIPVAADST